MKLKLFLFLLFSCGMNAFAQQPVISALDSNVIKTLFFTGLKEKLNENYEKAAESFNKILKMDANNAAVHYELAVLNFRQNKLLDAEIAIKKAASINADNIWYWKLLAELYKRNGNMDALVGVFNQMIRLSPDNDNYYFDRSNALLLGGKVEEAVKSYDELERKFGSSAELTEARGRVMGDKQDMRNKKKDNGNVEPPQSVGTQDPNDPKVMAAQAQQLYKKGDLNGALEQLKKVLKITDQLYPVWEQAMDIQMNLGLYKDVLKLGDEALAVFPNQAILYYYMAYAQQQEGKYDDALTNIKMAIQLDSENMIYLECFGDILSLKGDGAQAMVQWKKVQAGGGGSQKLKKKIDERKYIK
ncbi:tetratricopeptide repeat protein [Pedobacter frigoris]|uniref:tetratricopeptide repeat protein n=1 Tax=Pedobacter frigoris TaxID=2571272 RepID=UPI002930FE85|nr:tetratricopeptide repeat protein [Pedobacter frigoris]